jgi:hypothetical protein
MATEASEPERASTGMDSLFSLDDSIDNDDLRWTRFKLKTGRLCIDGSRICLSDRGAEVGCT